MTHEGKRNVNFQKKFAQFTVAYIFMLYCKSVLNEQTRGTLAWLRCWALEVLRASGTRSGPAGAISFYLQQSSKTRTWRFPPAKMSNERYTDMFRILVVEDNPDMLELFCTVLSDHGYHCFPASDGLKALEVMYREYIDLIVADIMMPGMDGYELTESLRNSGYTLPILMVTAKDQFEDMQRGFRAGTDDYMVKPVNVNELVLRVEALLRRARISTEKKITVGETILDYDALTVTIDGRETIIPQKEFYLLYKLLSYPNKTFTRQQLMDEIWGMDTDTDERTINTHINRLRERFAGCGDFEIVTERGLGYKAVKKVE